MRRSCGLVGRSFYHVSSPGSMSGSGRMSPLYAAQKSTSAFIALIFSFCFCVPVSLCPQAMSTPRTTCCSLPRLSRATLPEKTSVSGCCSSEAKSCARWEWYMAIVTPLQHTLPERICAVRHLGRWSLITSVQCRCRECPLFSHALLF